MSAQWDTAKHCLRALSLLAHRIHQGPPVLLTHSSSDPVDQDCAGGRFKKRRLNKEASPRPDGVNYPSTPTPPATSDRSAEQTSGVTTAQENTASPPTQTLLDAPDSRFFSLPDESATTAMMDLDLDMVDLLQGGNFDNLLDMFGQQYPSF